MKINFRICVQLCGIMASILTTQLAFAYIPPASFILERTLKAREGLKALEMVFEVQDLARNQKFNETLRLDFLTGRFWSVVTEPEGALSLSKFGSIRDLNPLGRSWITFAYEPSETRFREWAGSLKLWPTDKTETKLVREDGRVRWAWGLDQQLGIEKDLFVFGGYQDSSKNKISVKDQARFPRVILFQSRGTDRFTATLRSFKINTPVKWNTQQPVAPQGVLADAVSEWVDLVR
jgi:hypothetical protein